MTDDPLEGGGQETRTPPPIITEPGATPKQNPTIPEVRLERRGQREGNPPTKCAIAWNTVSMAAAIDGLRSDRHPAQDADLAHVSPCRYGHINPYGKYAFDLGEELGRAVLRPLRLGRSPT
jgi:hypothetical protein